MALSIASAVVVTWIPTQSFAAIAGISPRPDNLEKAYGTKPLLNRKLRALIDSRIASVPADARIGYAEMLVKHLRKVQTKSQSPRTKRLASEMISYLEMKMDEIEADALLPSGFRESPLPYRFEDL